MTIKGLWPDDLKAEVTNGKPQENAPEEILRVQASDLGTKTKNLLQGRIERSSQGEWLTLDFYITVPSLDHYSYHLFKVRHKVPPYPVEIISAGLSKELKRIPAENRAEFEHRLKAIFGSPPVRKIVQNLLTYARRSPKSATA